MKSTTINTVKTDYYVGQQYIWTRMNNSIVTLYEIIPTTYGVTFAIIIVSDNPPILDTIRIDELQPIK